MIEPALYEHLKSHAALAAHLATYNGVPAVFSQEAPADRDPLWGDGPQYGRIVFAVDLQGDPERDVSATLAVDILCKENKQFPEEIEPIVRELIDGHFFSNGTFTMAAQWKTSSYFTEPTDHVTGCTVAFDLMAFPAQSTGDPDVIARINEWTGAIDGLHVINHDALPSAAWKPERNESAVYWQLVSDGPAGWIPDRYQTIWRKSTLRCHVFSESMETAAGVARDIYVRLHTAKRLMKSGESPIMVNQKNTVNYGADPLRTGQLTVEATYGIIVRLQSDKTIEHINYQRKETL